MAQEAAESPVARIPAAHVAAVSIGNALEFYDFLTFSLFAVYIGEAFFPGANATDKLLASLATFWAGFLTRPIGAMVLGPLGDRIGRKPTMLISFVLIGVGMLGLALTPTYAHIGIAAPVLAVAFRLVQGFALGGNVGPTTAYMLEAAPPRRRGFYTSFQYTSQGVAVFASALMGWALARLLNPHDLAAWGWRLAFFAGVLIYRWFGTREHRSVWAAWACVAGLGVALAIHLPDNLIPAYEIGMVLIGMPAIAIAAGHFEPDRLSGRLFSFVGLISYGVYIVHQPLGNLAVMALRRVVHIPSDLRGVLFGLAFLAFLVLLTWALDVFYDAPVRRVLRATFMPARRPAPAPGAP